MKAATLLLASAAAAPAVLPLQRLQRRPQVGESIPAWGSVWPSAVYWCFVEIGTPPVRTPVSIDSGSPFLAIEGKGCNGCVTKPPNVGYDPKLSSTSEPYTVNASWKHGGNWVEIPGGEEWGNTSTFKFSYKTCDLKHLKASCSIEGNLYKDKVTIAGKGPVDIVLGAIEYQTPNFDQFKEIDGFLGIMPTTPGDYANRNVFGQLVANNLVDNVWSMCIHDGSISTGTLTIGGVDERLVDGPIHYVRNLGQNSGTGLNMYVVKILGAGVGGNPVAFSGTAILDSGTNVQLFPAPLYNALREETCSDASLRHCQELFSGQCVEMTAGEIAAYPPISITLDGTVIEMRSVDYLLSGSPLAVTPSEICIGLKDGGSTGGSGFLIGDTMMRNYYIVYDLGRAQIGWGRVNRQTCGSLNDSAVPERTEDLVAEQGIHAGIVVMIASGLALPTFFSIAALVAALRQPANTVSVPLLGEHA